MISIQGVTKRFGRVLALDDVSIDIAAGARVALVGTNGSGKTTLLRALCGLLRVEGSIRIGGVDPAERPEVALQALAYMPQATPPLEAPVSELVRAYCSLRGSSTARAEECAALLGLSLGPIKQIRVRDLSGGMKQKLLAALALASEAPILVCDEPTASLDAAARAKFFELTKARPSSSSLLLCSHRLEEVGQLVDRVVELKDRRVTSDESVSDALQRFPACCIELSFKADSLAGPDLDQLEIWGFQRLDATRFRGSFAQAQKLSRIESCVARFASRMVDIRVVDNESFSSWADMSMRRAS